MDKRQAPPDAAEEKAASAPPAAATYGSCGPRPWAAGAPGPLGRQAASRRSALALGRRSLAPPRITRATCTKSAKDFNPRLISGVEFADRESQQQRLEECTGGQLVAQRLARFHLPGLAQWRAAGSLGQ